MKTQITRARKFVLQTSTVRREWGREDGMDLHNTVEPDPPPHPAATAGIDPRCSRRTARRQAFPRVGGAQPADSEEGRGV